MTIPQTRKEEHRYVATCLVLVRFLFRPLSFLLKQHEGDLDSQWKQKLDNFVEFVRAHGHAPKRSAQTLAEDPKVLNWYKNNKRKHLYVNDTLTDKRGDSMRAGSECVDSTSETAQSSHAAHVGAVE